MTPAKQRLVRRAVLARLKADEALTALVAATSINPVGVPAMPFIKLSAPVERPFQAAGVDGAIVSWDIHAFAGPRDEAGAVVETAEDHAGSIGAAVQTALFNDWLALEGGGKARLSLSDIRLLPDGGTEAYHWFAQINARVLA